MSKSRVPLYLGLAAAGAGGYYLYSAGGSPSAAKHQIKIDAEKAREKLPGTKNAEKFGTNIGKEAGANIDDAIARARAEGQRIPDLAQDGKEKLDELRSEAKSKFDANRDRISNGIDQIDRDVEQKAAEAKSKFNLGREKVSSSVDQIDRDVEQKAAEAKAAASGWFGGKK
ncbi:unnamed protein product [Penicillium glandicola]